MKIHPDFTIQQVGSTYVAVPVGEASKRFHGMLQLNETAAFLWHCMVDRDCTEADLIDALLQEYQIDRETATNDVGRIVALLSENGIFA